MDTRNPGKLTGRTFYRCGRNGIGVIVSDKVFANLARKQAILDCLKGHTGPKASSLVHLNGPIFAFAIQNDASALPWLVGGVELIQRLTTYIWEQGGRVVDYRTFYVPFCTWTKERIRASDLTYVTTPDDFEREFGISIECLMPGN